MNISLAEPEVDKCGNCVFYENGANNDEVLMNDWAEHKNRARGACHLYKEDVDLVWPEDTAVFVVNLQKVLLLPRLPYHKKCTFTSRLVAFNETFADMRKGQTKHKKH